MGWLTRKAIRPTRAVARSLLTVFAPRSFGIGDLVLREHFGRKTSTASHSNYLFITGETGHVSMNNNVARAVYAATAGQAICSEWDVVMQSV